MSEEFKKDAQKKALEAVVRAMEERIGALTCPDHGEKPRLKFSEDSGPGEQKMSFDCCCGKLAGMLQDALKG